MEVNLPEGTYILAVSGGVDSVTLLHILACQKDKRFVVAHYDHGIRTDSGEDRIFVQELALQYKLTFVYEEGKLGQNTSEAQARKARYTFLHKVREFYEAKAIVTAHHQDDVLETIILNLFRGTKHRGLYSLKDTETVKRPLLNVPKKELLRYANREGFVWREDSTNLNSTYLRNYIRLKILPRFDHENRAALLFASNRAEHSGRLLEKEVEKILRFNDTTVDRQMLILLPHKVSLELLAVWLRKQAKVELSRQLLERLVVAAKTGKNGSKIDVNKRFWLAISRTKLALIPRER